MNHPLSSPAPQSPAPVVPEASAPATRAHPLAGKYLLFQLGDESYGVSVLLVLEIMLPTALTVVGQLPHQVKGFVNLRGTAIPVICLRRRLGLAEAPPANLLCIVVVEFEQANHGRSQIGLLVDDVEEVVSLADSDFVEMPDFGDLLDTTCLIGLARVKGGVTTLLDIIKVVGGSGTELLPPNAAA